MKRRDFLRFSGLLPLTLSFPFKENNAFLAWPKDIGSEQNISSDSNLTPVEPPFPYDSTAFEAAERIVFLNPYLAIVNVIPKRGLSLDIRLVLSLADIFVSRPKTFLFQAVKDSLDMPIKNYFWGPEMVYRIEYRETTSKGSWKATPWRRVKTPFSFLQKGTLKIIFYSDDHTFDDADMGTRIVKDNSLREKRLSGDYVNLFL